MLRNVARRLATILLLLGGCVLLVSIVVALAYRGELGEWSGPFLQFEFGAWVASLETALVLVALGLLALMFVPIDGERADLEDSDEPDAPEVRSQPVSLSDCPSCGADLTDIVFTAHDFAPECPNCGEDLLDAIEEARAGPASDPAVGPVPDEWEQRAPAA